jgi:hypothetical protein
MRVVYAAILFFLLPGFAFAQQSRSDPDPPSSSTGLPLPQIGLPLPQIGLPLPQIGLPPAQPRRVERPIDRRNQAPDRRPPGDREGKRGPRPPQVVVYPVPVYGWSQPIGAEAAVPADENVNDTAPPPAAVPAPAADRQTGALRLDLQPETDAQLYVDGYFIGTIADMGTELGLSAGPHTIDVRADGYEPMSVNVKIDADRTITYRGALQSARANGASPAPRAVPKPAAAQRGPFYMIPGCYLGNVPPAEAALPKTCDPRRAVTVWP